MEYTIAIREALSEQDVSLFWEQLRQYQMRDLFPDPNDPEREYFLNDTEYKASIQQLHDREHDRLRYLFFHQNGQDIGLAMPVIYETEDGKCFLLEFCVFPEYRGDGTGSRCAEVFLEWARAQQAAYVELNYGGDERRLRFWQRAGFSKNGVDEWGNPLMILLPDGFAEGNDSMQKAEVLCEIQVLEDPEDWQLLKLENGYLAEIGEELLDDEKIARLQEAIRQKKITFFLAKRGYRAVGMCSVAAAFSTFSCAEVGMFEDFYVEPVFRRQGIGRMLAQAAQQWCRDRKISSLTVCCAPCDEQMYQGLGFSVELGKSLAWLIG